jgi:hypothetical protein
LAHWNSEVPNRYAAQGDRADHLHLPTDGPLCQRAGDRAGQRGSPTAPMTMRSARTWLNDCFSLIEMTRRLGLRKGPPDLGISSKRRFPLRRSPTPTFEKSRQPAQDQAGSAHAWEDRDWDWQRTQRFDKPFWDVVDNRRKLLYSRKSAADMLVTPVRRDPIPDRAAPTTCRIFSRRRRRRALMAQRGSRGSRAASGRSGYRRDSGCRELRAFVLEDQGYRCGLVQPLGTVRE